jgi:hypothetical protein
MFTYIYIRVSVGVLVCFCLSFSLPSYIVQYLLKEIAGPKCVSLKVLQPEKCSFKPKELLALVIEIFMNLAKHEDFAPAVSTLLLSHLHTYMHTCMHTHIHKCITHTCMHTKRRGCSLNMHIHSQGIVQVIRDERSYDNKVLLKVERLLRNHGLKDDVFINQFHEFIGTLTELNKDRMDLDASESS